MMFGFKYRRLTLRRNDGEVYLDRWGVVNPSRGGVYLHRMKAPDPGMDLHDHPWPFVSIILRGGYHEIVGEIRTLLGWDGKFESVRPSLRGPVTREWKAGSVHVIGMDKAHTIITLNRNPTWTLVFLGPVLRKWGFYETMSNNGWTKRGEFVDNNDYASDQRGVYVERQTNDSNG